MYGNEPKLSTVWTFGASLYAIADIMDLEPCSRAEAKPFVHLVTFHISNPVFIDIPDSANLNRAVLFITLSR